MRATAEEEEVVTDYETPLERRVADLIANVETALHGYKTVYPALESRLRAAETERDKEAALADRYKEMHERAIQKLDACARTRRVAEEVMDAARNYLDRDYASDHLTLRMALRRYDEAVARLKE